MLDDTVAALRKSNVELNTALAQRDVAIRQLEEKLRAVQVLWWWRDSDGGVMGWCWGGNGLVWLPGGMAWLMVC